jgi:probable HAF family extracellular repeat protein
MSARRFAPSLRLTIGALGLAAGSIAVSAAPSRFVVVSVTLTELGSLGGPRSAASDVNDVGQISGTSQTASGVDHAFRYDAGVMIDHGQPGIASAGLGLNDSGYVVGWQAVDTSRWPTLWDAFGPVPLQLPLSLLGHGCLPGGEARRITRAGAIIGTSWLYTPGGAETICDQAPREALLWPTPWLRPQAGGPRGPGDVQGLGINASQTTVGINMYAGTETFRWVNGAATAIPGPLVPGGEAVEGIPYAINDWGYVAGVYTVGFPGVGTQEIAFLWNGVDASSTALAPPPGTTRSGAYDLNESIMVAGDADVPTRIGRSVFVVRTAILWHADFGALQLPSLSGVKVPSCTASGLNNWNPTTRVVSVVGNCVRAGAPRAVRWDVHLWRQPPN